MINPTFELAEKERSGHFGFNNTYIRMYNSRGEMIYKEATAKSDLSSKVEQWNPGPIHIMYVYLLISQLIIQQHSCST